MLVGHLAPHPLYQQGLLFAQALDDFSLDEGIQREISIK
jgi:hypothetical protein